MRLSHENTHDFSLHSCSHTPVFPVSQFYLIKTLEKRLICSQRKSEGKKDIVGWKTWCICLSVVQGSIILSLGLSISLCINCSSKAFLVTWIRLDKKTYWNVHNLSSFLAWCSKATVVVFNCKVWSGSFKGAYHLWLWQTCPDILSKSWPPGGAMAGKMELMHTNCAVSLDSPTFAYCYVRWSSCMDSVVSLDSCMFAHCYMWDWM